MGTLLTMIADDKRTIAYRPRLNTITGSVNATILFQQIVFRWENNEGKPFYKFSAPAPENKHYRKGDSWQEELGFTRSEFEGARNRIAVQVGKGQSKDELLQDYAIVYWRDHQNLTWYDLNAEIVEHMIASAYANAENLQSRTKTSVTVAENLQSRMQESCNLSNAENLQPSLLQDSCNPISENKNPEINKPENQSTAQNGDEDDGKPEIIRGITIPSRYRKANPFEVWMGENRGDMTDLKAAYLWDWIDMYGERAVVAAICVASLNQARNTINYMESVFAGWANEPAAPQIQSIADDHQRFSSPSKWGEIES